MTQMLAVERSSCAGSGSPDPQQSPAGLGGKGNWTASLHHRWLLRLVDSGRALRESESPGGSQGPWGRGPARPVSSAFSTDWSARTRTPPPTATWGLQWLCWEGPTQRSPQPHMGRGSGAPRHPRSPLLRPQGCMYHSALNSRPAGLKSFLPHLQGAAILDRKLSSHGGTPAARVMQARPRTVLWAPGQVPGLSGPSSSAGRTAAHRASHELALREPQLCAGPRPGRLTDVTHRADSRPALGSGSAPPRRERDPFV